MGLRVAGVWYWPMQLRYAQQHTQTHIKQHKEHTQLLPPLCCSSLLCVILYCLSLKEVACYSLHGKFDKIHFFCTWLLGSSLLPATLKYIHMWHARNALCSEISASWAAFLTDSNNAVTRDSSSTHYNCPHMLGYEAGERRGVMLQTRLHSRSIKTSFRCQPKGVLVLLYMQLVLKNSARGRAGADCRCTQQSYRGSWHGRNSCAAASKYRKASRISH